MIDQLIEVAKEHNELKRDHGPKTVRKVSFRESPHDGDLQIHLLSNGTALNMTPWALRQVCERLGPVCFKGTNKSLPVPYFSKCLPRMAASHLNEWTLLTPEHKKWLIRENDGECRAVLSDSYGVVDVLDVLEMVKHALDTRNSGPVRFYDWFVEPDVLHLKMLFAETEVEGEHFGLGAYVTTGEIGNRRLQVHSLIKMTSCDNSTILDGKGFSWTHTHRKSRYSNHNILRRLMADSIFQVLEGSVEGLEKFLALKEEPVEDFTQAVERLVAKRGWTLEAQNHILVGSNREESLFGLSCGVSYAAQKMEDADLRVEMETVAGQWVK